MPKIRAVSGRDDLDLHGREAAPGRVTPAIWLIRVLGVLAGAVAVFYGVGFYFLRCFSTCPSDPSLDKTIQLLTVSLALFGLVVAIASASAGTRSATRAAAAVAVLGAAIAVAGLATLALAPSIDAPSDGGGTAFKGAVTLVAGVVITAVAVLRRRGATQARG